MAFGDGAQSIVIPRVTDGTGAWVTVATLNMPAGTTAGDYFVEYVCSWQTSSASAWFECRVLLDGATSVAASRLMQELIPGNVAGTDTREGFHNFASVALTAGAHTLEFQIQADLGIGTVTVDNGNLSVWKLDSPALFYSEVFQGTGVVTSSTSYTPFVDTGTLTLPAGKYRVLWATNCQHNQLARWMGFRCRRVRDPAGVAAVTNMFGDDAGGANELYGSPTQNLSTSNADPSYPLQHINGCLNLDADDYVFEQHFRARPGFAGSVRIDNGRIGVMQLP